MWLMLVALIHQTREAILSLHDVATTLMGSYHILNHESSIFAYIVATHPSIVSQLQRILNNGNLIENHNQPQYSRS